MCKIEGTHKIIKDADKSTLLLGITCDGKQRRTVMPGPVRRYDATFTELKRCFKIQRHFPVLN